MYSMEDAVKDHAKVVAKEGESTGTILKLAGLPPFDSKFYGIANLYGAALSIINELQKELDERNK